MATTDLYLAQTRESETHDWQNVGGFCATQALAEDELLHKAPKGRTYRILKSTAEVVEPTPPASAVTVTGLTPATAVVGSPDVVVHVAGTGFTAASQIVWNGGGETTVYVSPTELTTLCKPSTASGPVVVPVGVTGSSQTQDFTFTAAPPA